MIWTLHFSLKFKSTPEILSSLLCIFPLLENSNIILTGRTFLVSSQNGLAIGKWQIPENSSTVPSKNVVCLLVVLNGGKEKKL